jgi:uncharacterized protein YbgA (DUF1722 family)
MDKGLATKANLEWLTENKYHFIAKDRRIKREFDPSLAENFDTHSGSIIEAYKIEDDTWPGLTKLLCHSKDRQIKEEAMLRQAALRM